MRLLRKDVNQLAAGYGRLSDAVATLRQIWWPQLSAAYARTKEGHPPESSLPSTLPRPTAWEEQLHTFQPAWWEALTTAVSAESPTPAAAQFLDQLLALPLDDHFALYGWQPQPGFAADAIIVAGSTGLWAFVARGWSGAILCEDEDLAFAPANGSEPSPQERRPFAAVMAVREALGGTLSQNGPLLADLTAVPHFFPVRGGVVFTHQMAAFQVDARCPVDYGQIDEWAGRLQSAPRLDNLKLDLLWRILETLLRRHQSANELSAVRSMNHHVDDLIEKTAAQFQQWIEN